MFNLLGSSFWIRNAISMIRTSIKKWLFNIFLLYDICEARKGSFVVVLAQPPVNRSAIVKHRVAVPLPLLLSRILLLLAHAFDRQRWFLLCGLSEGSFGRRGLELLHFLCCFLLGFLLFYLSLKSQDKTSEILLLPTIFSKDGFSIFVKWSSPGGLHLKLLVVPKDLNVSFHFL